MNQTTPDEEEIFCQAVAIRDASRRDDYLRDACKSDARLRQCVDALLADHEQATHLFREVAAGITLDEELAAQGHPEENPEPGTIIGNYRLVHRLGEGGGGVVYEARQETPVRRKVALKILKRGRWRVMNRFQAERQALELMEHPNIARVLDAGMTADDRPYFVMELVRGTRITEHCARHAVPLAARLQLLQQVCAAVQHAHQKGIIHCDLKPSNILVTQVEGVPIPKVIDFGIAKAIAGNPADGAAQGYPGGTPAYMSPEQISGSKDIDTRSDIYSLGVIMYELLAGQPPFDAEEATKTGHDLRHRLLHEEPIPPSQRTGQGAALFKLNDDLDWIVMTALHKDRERRYATMRGLSHDIARYLANEPILARPPSRLYRLRKLVQRNRLASGAIAAGILTLVVGFTTSSLLYVKAEAAERKQAQLRAEAEEREHVARAAILLLQNRTAEADAEIQRMGGLLTQPSVEATDVFRKLATWNALRGDWKAASRRLLALSRVNRFDDADVSDSTTRDLVALAPALIEAGETEDYLRFQAYLLEQMGRTNNPIAAEQILKICLLRPPSPELSRRLEPIATVAERSLPQVGTVSINRMEAWRCFALGLWNFRKGRCDQAVTLLTMAANARSARGETVIAACSLAVRGMAFQTLGRSTDAHADRERAQRLVDTIFSSPLEFEKQGYWHDWLTARILLREASGAQSPP